MDKKTTPSNSIVSAVSSSSKKKKSAATNTIMSPRLLAQDAVNFYLEDLDPYAPHPSNVQSTFRPVVLALTHFVLSEKKRQSWTDYLEDVMEEIMVETKLANSTDSTSPPKPPPTSESSGPLPSLDRRTLARLDAFLNGVIWAVPASTGTAPTLKKNDSGRVISKQKKQQEPVETVSLMDGLSGFKTPQRPQPSTAGGKMNGSSILRSISSGGTSSVSRDVPTYPQIRSLNLTIRLELYLRTLFRVNKTPTHEPCVLAAEPPRALKARVEAIVEAFSETVGTVRQQGPVLTRLITYMTMELLAVSCLSETCKSAIRSLVVDYEHQTSFASLAFLSSPEDAADQKLVPLLQRYFVTLKGNWETAIRDCKLEEMLVAVLDPEMRNFFKTVEFTSIGHLLTCAHGFRNVLHNIELPPTYTATSTCTTQLQDEGQIRQAIRDLQRERITVNGHLLPIVTSRTELVRLMAQTLNSESLTSTGGPKSRRRSRRKRGMRRSDSEPAKLNSKKDHHQFNGGLEDGSDEFSSSSANESDGGSLADAESNGDLSVGSTNSSGRPFFDVSTIDLLTKRLLLAASRTGTAGDAYFIVCDLFGGKDVQVLAHQPLHGLGGTPATTMELWAHMGSLTIQCHTSFDVYPLMQDRGNRDPYAIMDHCEPLIQLHTTTTEVIALREVRAADAKENSKGLGDGKGGEELHVDHNGAFVLQERVTAKTGWRTLSIRPAVYEKLEVWTTPS
eukprot:CAMPEP_0172441478 /NCGR_PEP_ID=MMETSP1065-20121228/2028_1 /TAXON_ID=265537 /ORGANISM="Amphiprora paludosa, Strain CCMP125" /LENGTH=730 /DNA_ID=CAMNT_0013190875 /DNA_START=11 /DNA_END=2203 /DNA_ORIENTATION=-